MNIISRSFIISLFFSIMSANASFPKTIFLLIYWFYFSFSTHFRLVYERFLSKCFLCPPGCSVNDYH